jgi:tetrahydromethanopterin S-methyltransferase subunit B
MPRAVPWYISAVLYVGIPAAVSAALYMSIPGEMALAGVAGWTSHYAPAMPVCLSVYALAAGSISWYRRKMKLPGEWTALIGGAFALLLAMSAQSISHLIEQDYMETSALLTVAVSCVPPLVIAHLIHMAETPSQAKSATEELEESRGLIEHLTTALVASESAALVSHAGAVLVEVERVTETVEELSQEAEGVTEELEASLKAAESQPRRKALTMSREKIEKTRASLSAKGERVTVDKVCEALGISPATYYRYKAA